MKYIKNIKLFELNSHNENNIKSDIDDIMCEIIDDGPFEYTNEITKGKLKRYIIISNKDGNFVYSDIATVVVRIFDYFSSNDVKCILKLNDYNNDTNDITEYVYKIENNEFSKKIAFIKFWPINSVKIIIT